MEPETTDPHKKDGKMTTSDPTESTILEALSHVQHPEMKEHNLIELGMIPRVKVQDGRIIVTLALPFSKAAARNELIERIQTALSDLASKSKVNVETIEMTPEQRASFSAVAQGRDLSKQAKRSVRYVLAVMSGKGGVGKSSVAGLLACAIRRRGMRVGILDADITGPSIPRLFGLHGSPMGGPDGIIPPDTQTGIKIISINLLLPDENQPVVWRGPLIGRAIQQFWSDIAWGELDYLIVDLPPGTADAALTVMQSLPVHGIILVTSPQDLAGMVVRKAANMAKSLGIRLLGLVENMSYLTCPNCSSQIALFGPSRAEETAQQTSIDLLGSLPLDPQLAIMCDQGRIEAYEAGAFEPIFDRVLQRSMDRIKHDAHA
jgi:Mrp family chromosome partitioning ATPase